MKIRTSFVSNSSSASFIINKQHLNDFQIFSIFNHMKLAKSKMVEMVDISYVNEDIDKWEISDLGDYIKGSTNMDNFDMRTFLSKIGVDWQFVEYEGG